MASVRTSVKQLAPSSRLSSPLLLLLLLPFLLGCARAQNWRCLGTPSQCSYDPSSGILSLSLLNQTAAQLDSGDTHYLYGKFSVDIKYPPGYTGGSVMAFYLMDTVTESNTDPNHSEIDLEIYGGVDSNSLMYTSNLFVGGQQNLDQLKLPLDGAASFHKFTIVWNAQQIIWMVDRTPMRILNRDPNYPWPETPMTVRLSLWDSSYFTQLKADYSNGPYTIQVMALTAQGCSDPVIPPPPYSCPSQTDPSLLWNRLPSNGAVKLCQRVRNSNWIASFGWQPA